MPTLVNLTFDVADLIGADFDARRTKVWIETNIASGSVIDTTGKVIRLGDVKATVGADGKGTFTGLFATNTADLNPTGFLYQVYVDYATRADGRKLWSSGWFPLTATSDLALVAPVVGGPVNSTEDAVIASRVNDSGSQTRAALNAKYAVVRGSAVNPLTGYIHPSGYGAIGDGVADDTTAIQNAVNAATNGDTVLFDAKQYKVTAQITRPKGAYLRGAGVGLTRIMFSGADWCFSHAALDGQSGGGIEKMSIECSGTTAKGGIREGDYGTLGVFPYHTKMAFRDLYIVGPGPATAAVGSVGMLMSHVGQSTFDNVTISGWKTNLVMDRTTANSMHRITLDNFHYGALWTGQTTPQQSGQDSTYQFETLGPSGTPPADAYCLKVDGPNLTMYSPYYETTPAVAAGTMLHITANGGGYREIAGRWQPTSVTTNTLKIDATASVCYFDGTWLSASGGAAPASSIGAPGTAGGFNGNHLFTNCDTRVTDTLAAAVTAGYAMVTGPMLVNRTGSGVADRQYAGVRGLGYMLPSHIYSDSKDPTLSASATINDAAVGKVSMMAGAGTTPPTPVVEVGSNDRRGTITFGSGATPSGNQVVRVNFSQPYAYKPHVTLTDIQGSSALQPTALSVVTTDYFIVNAPVVASQPNTAYSFSFMVEA